jgi:hypothetical protein
VKLKLPLIPKTNFETGRIMTFCKRRKECNSQNKDKNNIPSLRGYEVAAIIYKS